LFPNYREVELDYYRKTKIFPIMHTVAIRREVYEANRWIAMALFKAFQQAQHKTYEDLKETAALKAMVPWLMHDVEEARAEMGEDYWAYGYEQNLETFKVFLRYHQECGLSKRLLKPEELFAPETMEAFKI
jgi:4,5-dihydroxyphthalate decarboxylase